MIVRLKDDGTFHNVIKTRDGCYYEKLSEDHGVVYTPEDIEFFDSEAAYPLRLMPRGCIYSNGFESFVILLKDRDGIIVMSIRDWTVTKYLPDTLTRKVVGWATLDRFNNVLEIE